jgi:cytochrome c biogenesis protein CcdA/thiol-disulfide isomerase/thioredoxin
MVLTFAAIATLAAVGGSWAVNVNQYGRIFALVLLAGFAATLLSRRLADALSRPFVALGNRLSQPDARSLTSNDQRPNLLRSMLLGVATGMLWAPCAGPILGLVLTGAAISGPNTQTTLLLFAYAAGAATSLAVALLAGGRVFKALKKSLGTGEWIRRGLGVAVLLAVVAITFGWDTGVLTRLSTASTGRIEQSLIDKISPPEEQGGQGMTGAMSGAMSGGARNESMSGSMPGNAMMSKSSSVTKVEGKLSLDGATAWLNSPPLTPEALRGKVVLIDFWTYSCINCLRALPYVKGWYEKYKDHGLVVIGVHAPEFAFEKDVDNVRNAAKDLNVNYPVALDNSYAIWQAFNNQYWPAHYFVDAQGQIRGHHFGEGKYDETEQTLRALLIEAGNKDLPGAVSPSVRATGVQAAADEANVQSPETYVGYERAENFASPMGFARDAAKNYSLPSHFKLNEWGLVGTWLVEKEKSVLKSAPGEIVFRFQARDLHLVLGPSVPGKPVRFRVMIDGNPPGEHHGMDVDAEGNGVVKEQRLYQLIRQSKDKGNDSAAIPEHTFIIEFLDSNVQAYAFTFG